MASLVYQDETHRYIKVVLLSDKPIGQVQVENGGVVIIDENAELDFPPNAIQYATGLSYFGTVSVCAQSIVAIDPDLSFKMPGELTGCESNTVTKNKVMSMNANGVFIANGLVILILDTFPES